MFFYPVKLLIINSRRMIYHAWKLPYIKINYPNRYLIYFYFGRAAIKSFKSFVRGGKNNVSA